MIQRSLPPETPGLAPDKVLHVSKSCLGRARRGVARCCRIVFASGPGERRTEEKRSEGARRPDRQRPGHAEPGDGEKGQGDRRTAQVPREGGKGPQSQATAAGWSIADLRPVQGAAPGRGL